MMEMLVGIISGEDVRFQRMFLIKRSQCVSYRYCRFVVVVASFAVCASSQEQPTTSRDQLLLDVSRQLNHKAESSITGIPQMTISRCIIIVRYTDVYNMYRNVSILLTGRPWFIDLPYFNQEVIIIVIYCTAHFQQHRCSWHCAV